MDFAELGVKFDTKDIENGLRQLKEMQPASAGAAQAAAKLTKELSGLGLAQERAVVSAARARKQSALNTIETKKLTAAKKQEQRAIVKAADASIKASNARSANIKKIRDEIALQKRLSSAMDAATMATNKNNAALNQVGGSFAGGRAGGDGFGVAARPANDLAPNRFNTANIAAQFQDIGVTAAMGMSPMTIALQQGTQLSAILNSMSGSPLKGLAAAFKSIINPVSLLSIGIVGLLAAGVQFVDWTKVGSGTLNFFADAVENSTEALVTFLPMIIAVGAAFVTWKLPAITIGIVSMTKAIWGAVVAMNAFMLANPFKALIVGVVAALAAMYTFRDEIAKILGFDIFEAAKKGVNMMIGTFVGAYDVVLTQWGNLPAAFGDLTIRAVSNSTKAIRELVNDYIWASNKFLGTNFEDVTFGTMDNPFKGAAGDLAAQTRDIMETAIKGVDYVGIMGDKIQSGSKIIVDKLRQTATNIGMGEADKEAEKLKKKYDSLIASQQKRIEVLRGEQEAIGMSERAAQAYRIETELLAKAKERLGKLTPGQINDLKDLARETAELEWRNKQLKESYDLVKDTGKGFFEDMKTNLQDGKNMWNSFADAATNALNRIVDKFFEASLDMVFDNAVGAFGGGGGGGSFLSGIADFLFSAKGNAFTSSGVQEFAKGGSFTNGVVSSPTMFTFANGGKFGVMGEAGPEAVMPLRRGPDGSLGVQMVGGGGGSSVVVNVINNSGAQATTEKRQTSNGQEIDVMIDDIVAQKIGSQGTSSNRALQEANNRPLIRRG